MRNWVASVLLLWMGTANGQPTPDRVAATVHDFGAIGDGRTDDTGAQQDMAAAVGVTGGELNYPSGRYLTSKPIVLASNTRVHCAAGAVIVAPPGASEPGNFFRNVHSDVNQLMDHDIAVEGCSFEFTGNWRNPQHAIALHYVQHASIRFNRFRGGGNATAIVGSDDVETIGNVATDIHNACYDHWEGSSNLRVIDNACYLAESVAGAFGITGTGLSTALGDAPVAGLQIIGNRIFETGTQGACIELNSSPSSPVTRAQIIGNYCSIVPRDGAPGGIALSGAGGLNVIQGNIIEGAHGDPAIQEVDGTQHDNLISNNLLIGCSFAPPHRANLELNGTGDIVNGNKLSGCTGTPIYTTDGATLVSGNDLGDSSTHPLNTSGGTEAPMLGGLLMGGGHLASLSLQTGSIRPGTGGLGQVIGSGGTYQVVPHINVEPPSVAGVPAKVAITRWGLSAVGRIDDGGAGCRPGTLLRPVGGNGAPAALIVKEVDSGGEATVLSPYEAGDYSLLPLNPAALIVARGTCARTPTATLGFYIVEAAISNPGAGYVSAPKITLVGGLGSGGSIVATLAGPTVNYFGVPTCASATVGTLCAQGTSVQIK